jgi:hypothetical protein
MLAARHTRRSRHSPSALLRAEAGARCPTTLSPATWAFLARHIERAFVRQDTRETLRRAVRRAVAEMQSHGVGEAGVCRALERAVTEHPACARFDRMLIVTGEPYSRSVIATMQGWALAVPEPLPELSAGELARSEQERSSRHRGAPFARLDRGDHVGHDASQRDVARDQLHERTVVVRSGSHQ